MPLQTGTRLGPYEVTAQIGVGGMGESIGRGIRSWIGMSRSRSCPHRSPVIPTRIARYQREAKTRRVMRSAWADRAWR